MNSTAYKRGHVIRAEPIRAYLDNTMTKQQHADFEQQMFDDPELAVAVDAERQLRAAMQERYAGVGP